ncbi:gamma-glutamyltranspeptidase [Paraburkholderia sp. GAS448]
MDPKSPNVVEGGKRPFHTIVPAFLTQQVEGRQEAVMSFDVMGGDMQPQGHLRSVVRMLDYCQQPQAACAAPRLCSSCSRDLYRASRWAAKPAVRLH